MGTQRLMAERRLPDFEHPPAVETLLAIHFAPLPWSVPHFGLFWSEIKSDYPEFEVHPPAGEFRVEFDNKQPEARINLPVRCWFINYKRNRLIQVQSNGFFHNWRKVG